MSYWRSTSGFEVDLILSERAAVEIKGAKTIRDKHLKGLRALKEEGVIQTFSGVSCDRHERTTKDGIVIYPWQRFLEKRWRGEVISNRPPGFPFSLSPFRAPRLDESHGRGQRTSGPQGH